MRLSETRYIIETNLPLLDKVKRESVSGNSSIRTISNVYMIVPAIEALKSIPCLHPTINKITSNKIYSMAMESFTIEQNAADNFMVCINELKTKCLLIISLANDIVPKMDKNTICIKLPQNSSFDSIAKIASTFNDLCNLINTNERIEGTIKLIGVESGSMWLYVLASTVAVSVFIEKIVSNIYNIVKKHIEIKKSLAELKKIEYDIDIKEKQKDLLEIYTEKFIEKMNVDRQFEADPGVQGQWIKNITAIAKLIEDGMDIVPSLEAPKEKQENINREISSISSMIDSIKKLEAGVSLSKEPSTDDVSNNSSQDSNTPEE